jgi:hypothetical protein
MIMTKRIFLSLTILALTLAACGAASPQMLEESRGLVAPESAPAPFAPSDAAADTDSYSGNFGPGEAQTVERLVIKNASLSIVVSEPGESLAAIAKLAEDLGGFVVTSNLYQTTLESGAEVPRANITIRVPAERLNEALTAIEADASQVLSKNESGEDVTREYTDLKSRLRNLEDAEAQLREIMGSATKTEDVLSVFNQLTSVREQIEVITGQIQYYEQSAAFSAVNVDLLADEAVQPLTIGGWQPVGVAKAALQALINTLKFLADAAIWIVIYLLPVALILFVPLWLVVRGIRRRRARRRQAIQQAAPKE